MDWQSIDTAPRDGTPILLFCPKDMTSHKVHVGWWSDYETYYNQDTNEFEKTWVGIFSIGGEREVVDYFGAPTLWAPIELPKL
jgi:hypothetical protein